MSSRWPVREFLGLVFFSTWLLLLRNWLGLQAFLGLSASLLTTLPDVGVKSIQEELQNASLGLLLNIRFLVPIDFLLHLHSKTDPCSCHPPPIEKHPHGEEQSLSSVEYRPVPPKIFKSLGGNMQMLKVENLGTLKATINGSLGPPIKTVTTVSM